MRERTQRLRRFIARFSKRVVAIAISVAATTALLAVAAPAQDAPAQGGTDTKGWIELTSTGTFDAWKPPIADWVEASEAKIDPKNPRLLTYESGTGVIVNGPTGRTRNIVTKRSFGDVELHLEFFIPKGSNSGVKFEGLYEVQIFDSFGKKTLKGSDCGGIYPKAELLPRYHYLDDGFPPKVNACKPPGEWQTLDVTFHAPRFNSKGEKIKNARFDKVLLNGKLVQENVELEHPTGHAWPKKEIPEGPILLQADHGPVAFRAIRVKPIAAE